MQDTYSNDQLLAYGRRLAARLCDQYFATQPVGATLDGPAVLRLAPVRQLNLYVVQQLLAQWTQEMGRLRSPYFDYEDPAVRQALTQLMNLLSRRIRLTRDTYEPLLAQAAADTLRTNLDPVAIFETKLLSKEQPSATAAQLRDSLRYIDVNKPLFQGFVDGLPTDVAQEREALLKRFRLHCDAHYKDAQPLNALLAELTTVLPVVESDLRAAASAAPAAPVTQPAPVAPAAPAVQAAPLEPAPAPMVPVSPPVAEVPQPVVMPEPVQPAVAPAPEAIRPLEQPVPVVEPVPVAASVVTAAPAATERPKPFAVSVEPLNTLNDKLASNRPVALNEKLAVQASTSSIAEAQPKIESLRGAISINQRFSFINELFNGENMEYHAAIEHLDTLPTADAARRYVNEDLAQRYQWVRKEEHVNKLLRLIDRKFA